MSTYLAMWEKIKELSKDDILKWINVIEPAQGRSVDFCGVHCLDVDVLEALRNYLQDS